MGRREASRERQETGEAFAGLLRGLRQAAGLTQEELALRAGMSPNAVSALERGVRKRPYPHTVRALADALGLDETERTALLASVPAREAADAPAAGASMRGALPHPATPLLGRGREVEEVVSLLARPEYRLVTLTGIGGVGKTRLAVEVARAALDAGIFPDGAAFAGLAPLSDPSLVATAVLQSLGLKEIEGRTPGEVLRDYLRERRMLLVLDNFEHLLAAATEVAGLIEACPGISVLATSRAPLRVRAEQEYPVPPLALPPSTRTPAREEVLASPSGQLFLERARAVSPDFALTEENAGAIAEICWRLAGLPLALELAAARVRFLEPAELLPRLDRALSTAWARDLPERQRTMRAALDWSHDLLAETERVLFRRFSVFAGGFTLEAAEEVCGFEEIEPGEIPELLGGLMEQSLVTAGPAAGGLRYGMLEPVRQYALEKLEESGEEQLVRGRHAAHLVALAETARPGLMGPDHASWLVRLEREHDNLRETLRWARETGDAETGLRLVRALYWFWWIHGYLGEGRQWIEAFLSDSRGGQPTPARAMALYAAGELALGQGDPTKAVALLEESLDLYRGFGDEKGIAIVLAELGQAARAQGNYDRATALSEEGFARSRAVGHRDAAAIALNTLGHIECKRGHLGSAKARHEESLVYFRAVGNKRGVAYTLSSLAVAALDGGETEHGRSLSEESLSLYTELGDKAGMALALTNLGDVARERGQDERARVLYDDALHLFRELGNERGAARALARLANYG